MLPRDMVWEADRLCDPAASLEGRVARRIDAGSRCRWPSCPTADWRPGSNRRSGGCCASSHAATCCGGSSSACPPARPRPRRSASAAHAEELRDDEAKGITAALEAGGFVDRTPLWFYVLREAAVHAEGNSLGHVGSRILAETIVGLLLGDPASHLNDVTPWDRLPGRDAARRPRDPDDP